MNLFVISLALMNVTQENPNCDTSRPNRTDLQSGHFRVKSTDKSRAFALYQQYGFKYQEVVTRGIGRYLRDRERGATLELARFQRGETMLDMGTGAGFYALRAQGAGAQVTAVDIVPEMVTYLTGQVDEIFVSDVESFRSERLFDCVVCAGVLDFVLRPDLAISNLCRLVSPGGRLVLSVPRVGLGGWGYRLEKRWHGISINLFEEAWCIAQAAEGGLKHLETRKPLPNNMVILFGRPVF